MTTTTISAAGTQHAFDRRLEDFKPSKTDINNIIMDYLVSEGYPAAAQRFAAEANISPRANAESIQARVDIRSAIHGGDIQTAVERINDLSPELLDCDASLHFSLLRLQLIELIRKSSQSEKPDDIVTVFEFASAHLAPRAPTNPQFQEELERAMALLIYPSDNLTPTLSALLDPQLRAEVANKVNQAILHSQGLRREAKIKGLIKLRAWAEQKCKDTKKNIPANILRLRLDGDDQHIDSTMEDGRLQSTNGNGNDAMVT